MLFRKKAEHCYCHNCHCSAGKRLHSCLSCIYFACWGTHMKEHIRSKQHKVEYYLYAYTLLVGIKHEHYILYALNNQLWNNLVYFVTVLMLKIRKPSDLEKYWLGFLLTDFDPPRKYIYFDKKILICTLYIISTP